MSATLQGFLIILGAGLVVLAVAALADRHTRRRGEGWLQSPPQSGADATAAAPPGYVTTSELTAHQHLAPADEPNQALLRGATTIGLGLASADLATNVDHCSWAPDPRVLICDDAVETLRELLSTWEMLPPTQALTVVAPGFDSSVIDAFVANTRAGIRVVQALIGDVAARAQLAELTGATPVGRPSLQAGEVTITALGHAALIVASSREAHVAVPPTVG